MHEGLGAKAAVTAAVLVVLGQILAGGLAHYQAGEYELAVAEFSKIIDGYAPNQHTDDALYWRGAGYLKLGKRDQARADWQAVVDGFPQGDCTAAAESALLREFGPDVKLTADLSRRIGELVKQLSDADFALRESASAQLTEVGEPAVDELKQAAAAQDPEAKMRAEKILGDIEEHRLLARLDPLETRVTLKADNVLLSKVLKEIEKQTGNEFDLRPEISNFNDRAISCDFDHVPFWQAMQELMTKHQIGVAGDARSLGMRVHSGGGQENWPTAVTGPLKMSITHINSFYNFQDRQSYCNLGGQFWVEPRLHCEASYFPEVTRAVDDLGTPLTMQAQGRGVMNVLNDGVTGGWNVSLRNVPREARQISLVEGTITLVVPLVYDQVEVKDIENVKEGTGRKGQYAVRVTGFVRQQGRLTAQIQVERTFVAQEEQRWAHFGRQHFFLLDQEGNRIPPTTINQQSGNSDGTRYTWGGTVEFSVQPQVKLASFGFKFASRVMKKTVPFRLENVPLP